MITYITIAIISFIIGFVLAPTTKDNITIGFGNKTITQIYNDNDEDDSKRKR
jgi:hypothetical protein